MYHPAPVSRRLWLALRLAAPHFGTQPKGAGPPPPRTPSGNSLCACVRAVCAAQYISFFHLPCLPSIATRALDTSVGQACLGVLDVWCYALPACPTLISGSRSPPLLLLFHLVPALATRIERISALPLFMQRSAASFSLSLILRIPHGWTGLARLLKPQGFSRTLTPP